MAPRRSAVIGWSTVGVVLVVVGAFLAVYFVTKGGSPQTSLQTRPTVAPSSSEGGVTGQTGSGQTGSSFSTTGVTGQGTGTTGAGGTGVTGTTGGSGAGTGGTGIEAGDDFAGIVAAVTHLPASDYDGAGVAGEDASSSIADDALNPVKASGANLPKTDGKPTFFFFGAEYCPYCAMERWSLVTALSRFGTFSGLGPMASSPTDVYPDTQTFTFLDAHFSSPYIAFESVEYEDHAHKALQSLDASELSALEAWNNQGDFPFYDIAGKYIGALPDWDIPSDVAGMSRAQIAASLDQPTEVPASVILANANYVTAGICAVDGGQPGSVCNSSGVTAAAAQLAQMPAAQPLS